ncbi:hypothetical protein [Jannaschia marina]|uniref:hypothetical protein n=1 Tax=Jannaschia marina TaxID=2741674 RepID=UPI0015CBD230|nr:hypothetical protein [Jannaschia marina]
MIRRILHGATEWIPQLTLPELRQKVEIPVYVVHNSADPDDYFFIFDFEQFVERARSGLFVRPVLKVWSGRADLERRLFARRFRQSFAREFEAARLQLAQEKGREAGWFGWLPAPTDLIGLASTLTANVLLLLATQAGKALWGRRPLPGMLRRKSDEEQLEAAITETQTRVDAALRDLEIVLHIDLFRHAWRGRTGGRLTGMDYDAWPLPDFVTCHLDLGEGAR